MLKQFERAQEQQQALMMQKIERAQQHQQMFMEQQLERKQQQMPSQTQIPSNSEASVEWESADVCPASVLRAVSAYGLPAG